VQRLYNQKVSNETHRVSYHSTLLEGSWNQEPWLDIDFWCTPYRVHRFAPKFKFQPLCMNHVSCTFHDGSIGTFRNTVLLWGIRRTCLSLNSTFRKKCVTFLRHKFSSVIGT
jgi:hypothetical protein